MHNLINTANQYQNRLLEIQKEINEFRFDRADIQTSDALYCLADALTIKNSKIVINATSLELSVSLKNGFTAPLAIEINKILNNILSIFNLCAKVKRVNEVVNFTIYSKPIPLLSD